MAPHSSTLAWKILWMEEPGRLQSMGSEGRTRLSDFTFTFHFHALEKKMATYSSVLAWRIPGTGEPGGLPSMGSHRVGHEWRDLAAAAAPPCCSYFNSCYREAGGFAGSLVIKNLPADGGATGYAGSIPGSGRSPGEGSGNPLQYFSGEFHGLTKEWTGGLQSTGSQKSQTRLNTHTHT